MLKLPGGDLVLFDLVARKGNLSTFSNLPCYFKEKKNQNSSQSEQLLVLCEAYFHSHRVIILHQNSLDLFQCFLYPLNEN